MRFTSASAKPRSIRKSATALLGLVAYITASSLSAWLAVYVKTEAPSLGRIRAEASRINPAAANQLARQVLGDLPLSFEENRGQATGAVRFFSRTSGYKVFLKASEAVFEFEELEKAETGKLEGSEESVGCGERIELRSSAFRFAPSSSPASPAESQNDLRRESNRAAPCPCSTSPNSCPDHQTVRVAPDTSSPQVAKPSPTRRIARGANLHATLRMK